MANVLVKEETLSAIGEAIRSKTRKTETMKPREMADEISSITPILGEITITEPGVYEAPAEIDGYNHINVDVPPAPTDEDLTITGDCKYRFAYNGWNWVINKYGDKITTKDIEDVSSMFNTASKLEEIPFEINMKSIQSGNKMANMFYYCDKLKSIPKINNAMAGETSYMFQGCKSVRTLSEDIEDWFDWSYIDNLTSAYSGGRGNMFSNCYSLRKIPMGFLKHGNPIVTYSSSIYYSAFNNCYVLDEIVGLPLPHYGATWTSNAFNSAFVYCNRLKNMTFAVQEDGTPYSMKWKSQLIDLSQDVGHFRYSVNTPLSEWDESKVNSASQNIINYNSGITLDKAIYNDETYQLLKDDEDAYCLANNSSKYPDYGYSRYNHDSAVATINSLPDTSAYLATAGGTNTIKFFGRAGGKTDGGAINTLTEEEIAVAAAKGWTVSLV